MKLSRRKFFGLLLSGAAAALGWKTVAKPKARFDQSAFNMVGTEGVSIRHVQQYDPDTGRMIHRMDVLCGFGAMTPQWSCRVLA